MRFAADRLRNTGLLSDGEIVIPEPNLNIDPESPAFIREQPVEVAELRVGDFIGAAADADTTGTGSFNPNKAPRSIRAGGKFGGASGIDALGDRYMDPTHPTSGTYDPAMRSFFPGV